MAPKFYAIDYEALILERQEAEIYGEIDPDYRGYRTLPTPRPTKNPPRRKRP